MESTISPLRRLKKAFAALQGAAARAERKPSRVSMHKLRASKDAYNKALKRAKRIKRGNQMADLGIHY